MWSRSVAFTLVVWCGGAALAQDGPIGPIVRQGEVYYVGSDAGADFIPPHEELLTVGISTELLTLAQRLGHSDFETRERATEAIVEAPGDDVQIYALLAREQLNAEQRLRLIAALRERIMSAPRGALGIQMNTRLGANQRIEVEVVDLIPGLPAERVLRVGDRIIEIDGRRLQSVNDVPLRVQARRPGERVTLTVQRHKRDRHGRPELDERDEPIVERIEVLIELGSADLLREADPVRSPSASQLEARRMQQAQAIERRFRLEPPQIELAGELPSAARGWRRDHAAGRGPALRTPPRQRQELAGALVAAISDGDEGTAIGLIEHGAPIDARSDPRGVTVLHRAAQMSMAELARLLLEYGADVHARVDGDGSQPIHWASRAGAAEIANRPRGAAQATVDVLLEYGANINATTPRGVRPITFADEFSNAAWKQFLISRGAIAQ